MEGAMDTDVGPPPRLTRDGEEGALVTRLLALGHASIEVAELFKRGTQGMTLAERLERLLDRRADGEARFRPGLR
jgi:hypothetical protein